MVTTYNNLSCYFKKANNAKQAMYYLEKALQMQYNHLSSADDEAFIKVRGLADTHINLSAVLSQLGYHKSSLLHAKKGLLFIQDELLHDNKDLHGSIKCEKWSLLILTFHNMGAEYEHLKMVFGIC